MEYLVRLLLVTMYRPKGLLNSYLHLYLPSLTMLLATLSLVAYK
jgi:hypothetical protein